LTQNSFWIGLAAIALAIAAGWLILTILPNPNDSLTDADQREIRLQAENPWMIGDPEDAFDYAGESVRTISGIANLVIDPDTDRGTIEFTLYPDERLAALLKIDAPESPITLRMQLSESSVVWTNQRINRGTGFGDSRLPVTHALYAGDGEFELLGNTRLQSTAWYGFWSLADALRQSDGAIRNQGLVFSPLLRDQSVFSDSARSEFTLLLYEAVDSDTVILHLVFPDAKDVAPSSQP